MILNGTCESARTPVTATILNCNEPPSLGQVYATATAGSSLVLSLLSIATDPDNNLDTASFQVVVPPVSQAATSIINGILTIDYADVNFAGTDSLTIQVCDAAGACTQQVMYINVIGDLIIFNAISPNGDGKNDVFIIQHIDIFPQTQQNQLRIFNRWGDEVFSATNYDNYSNVFRGISKDGKDLPTETYFYKLSFQSGVPERTGFISLRR